MTIKELYLESIKFNYYSLILLIEFLLYKKQVITLDDDISKIEYYLQPEFRTKMNEYLKEYDNERQHKQSLPLS